MRLPAWRIARQPDALGRKLSLAQIAADCCAGYPQITSKLLQQLVRQRLNPPISDIARSSCTGNAILP